MYLNNKECETIMGTGPAPPQKKTPEKTLNACIRKVIESKISDSSVGKV